MGVCVCGGWVSMGVGGEGEHGVGGVGTCGWDG